jgi:hypothetical protein
MGSTIPKRSALAHIALARMRWRTSHWRACVGSANFKKWAHQNFVFFLAQEYPA